MVINRYIPDAGDIVWISFDPSTGREHKKRRPALVLTPKEYSQKTNLLIACPITSKVKGYPFEVYINVKKIDGVVLVDQVKSLDWKSRKAAFIARASRDVHDEVLGMIYVLLFTKMK